MRNSGVAVQTVLSYKTQIYFNWRTALEIINILKDNYREYKTTVLPKKNLSLRYKLS